MTLPLRGAARYPEFRCTGSACEDSCCIGWQVDLDRKTFHAYKQSQHKPLVKLIKAVVKRNHASSDEAHFGTIAMGRDGRCPFLDPENLCQIQRQLGEQALSPVCATYPRRVNRYGQQLEVSLALSCPEAARLMLLDTTPMHLTDLAPDPRLPGVENERPAAALASAAQAERHMLRAFSLHILQCRSLEIDERLILLGLFFESIAGEQADIPEIEARFDKLLGERARVSALLAEVESDPCLQLEFFGAFVSRLVTDVASRRLASCLIESLQGLSFTGQAESDDGIIDAYLAIQETHYALFYSESRHILENSLAHHLFHEPFPDKTGDWLAYYRSMCTNYFMLRTMLLGQAALARTLTPDLAILTVQSLSRLSAHHADYAKKINETCAEHGLTDFRSLFGLIAAAFDPSLPQTDRTPGH